MWPFNIYEMPSNLSGVLCIVGLMIISYPEEGKEQEIRALLREMDEHISRTRTVRYCENLAVNGILNYCARQAEEKGIIFEVRTEIPQRMELNEFEFATVVSNLLENALNAAALVEEPKRRAVRISTRSVKGRLILEISNGCVKEPQVSKLTGYPLSEGGNAAWLRYEERAGFRGEKQGRV